MRFAFSETQLEMRDAARSVFRGQCSGAEVRAAWESESGRVSGLWSTLAEVGLLGLIASEQWDGMGLSELELVLVLEESGEVALPEPLLETAAVGIPLLQAVGSDALKDRWLGPAVAGKSVFAIGLGAPYVAGAAEADLLLLARDGALYALEPARATLQRRPSVDGSRHLYAVDWSTDDAELIAEGDVAAEAIDTAFDRGALGAAAQLIGLARRMIEMTVEHGKNRNQFGRPIGSFQAVKHQLADAHIQIEMARPAVYRGAYSLANADSRGSLHVSMAKALASDAANLAARAALQCHGAIGYSYEYDLQLWMKRTWALATAWGDAAWHRARVADNLLVPSVIEGPGDHQS